MGHKQQTTPLQTDNAIESAVIKGIVQPKRKKSNGHAIPLATWQRILGTIQNSPATSEIQLWIWSDQAPPSSTSWIHKRIILDTIQYSTNDKNGEIHNSSSSINDPAQQKSNCKFVTTSADCMYMDNPCNSQKVGKRHRSNRLITVTPAPSVNRKQEAGLVATSFCQTKPMYHKTTERSSI